MREFCNEIGPTAPSAQRIVVAKDGQMRAYRVSFPRGHTVQRRIAVYNWSESPQTVSIQLEDAGIRGRARWRMRDKLYSKGVRLSESLVISEAQPPHSLRIADLLI